MLSAEVCANGSTAANAIRISARIFRLQIVITSLRAVQQLRNSALRCGEEAPLRRTGPSSVPTRVSEPGRRIAGTVRWSAVRRVVGRRTSSQCTGT